MAKLLRESAFVNNGERRVVAALMERLGPDDLLLSNVYIRDHQQMIEVDIIAITAHGVSVIEVKDWAGNWSVRDGFKWQRGRDESSVRENPWRRLLKNNKITFGIVNGLNIPRRDEVKMIVCNPIVIWARDDVKIPEQDHEPPVRRLTSGVEMVASGVLGAQLRRTQSPRLSPKEIWALGQRLAQKQIPCRTVGNYVLKNSISYRLGYQEFWAEEVASSKRVVRLKRHELPFLDEDTLPKQLTLATRQFETFRRLESRRLRALPNVYTSFLDQDDESLYWTAYEGVVGEPLAKTCLPTKARLAVLSQITDTLAACHAARIYHRGLSPDCLIVDSMSASDGPRPYVLHFDFARIDSKTQASLKEIVQHRLGEDPLQSFTAPEVLTNPTAADSRSDVFSLGKTISATWPNSPMPLWLSDLLVEMTIDDAPYMRPSMAQVAARLRERIV